MFDQPKSRQLVRILGAIRNLDKYVKILTCYLHMTCLSTIWTNSLDFRKCCKSKPQPNIILPFEYSGGWNTKHVRYSNGAPLFRFEQNDSHFVLNLWNPNKMVTILFIKVQYLYDNGRDHSYDPLFQN